MLFSVDHYNAKLSKAEDAILQMFFNSLKLGKLPVTAGLVPIDGLMEVINLKNRWVYKGSETVPECSRFVYWNVV